MTAAAHVFAMNGLPWTDALIAHAAARISHGGSIGFGFGVDAPAHLADLDAQVFSRRPDLQLRVWRVGDDRRLTDADLRALALNRLKTWSNPEASQTLPALQTLTLQEINTKLRAEQFAVLPALPGLRRVDIRFIDTGARRRAGIEALFAAAGRQALLVADEDEGQDKNPGSPAA